MTKLQVGELAPDFTAIAHDGQEVSLARYRGYFDVVIFFYPRDNSLICTLEACQFRDAYEDFGRAGAVVIGISSDNETRHGAFARSHRLPYLMLSDQTGELRRLFHVPRTWGLFPGRSTFVIDRTGVIRMIYHAQFDATGHAEKALAVVRQLAAERPAAATMNPATVGVVAPPTTPTGFRDRGSI